MTSASQEYRIATIVRLLAPYENRLGDDRSMLIHCFLDAVLEYSDEQVEDGYLHLVSAKLDTFTGAYAPSPTQLAHACREALNVKLDSAARLRRPSRPSDGPPIPATPESKQRVADLLEIAVRNLSAA